MVRTISVGNIKTGRTISVRDLKTVRTISVGNIKTEGKEGRKVKERK
jgi:hypothetical protein